MNRSRYVSRPVDNIDRAIIGALANNARMTVRDLAAQVNLSGPSTAERIRKLEDCGAIASYTIATDLKSIGFNLRAHVTIRAMPGEATRISQLLASSPEIVEADRVTGSDCFIATAVAKTIEDFENLIDRFVPYSATETAIVQSSPVTRRLPKF